VTRPTARGRIAAILDIPENLSTHARRDYWANQIRLIGRREAADELRRHLLDEYGPITGKGETARPVNFDEIVALVAVEKTR
jgi:hypothetical protein